MDLLTILRTMIVLVVAAGLAYWLLQIRRRRSGRAASDIRDGFRPSIGFTTLDGMASLALLLSNKSKAFIWMEEIEIFLADLDADEQVGEASCHEILKIHQMVGPSDMLTISLAEVIYKAAGEPQRSYSGLLSSVLRYRISEEWFETVMEDYKIHMIGLIAAKARRVRGTLSPLRAQDKSPAVHAIETKSKSI